MDASSWLFISTDCSHYHPGDYMNVSVAINNDHRHLRIKSAHVLLEGIESISLALPNKNTIPEQFNVIKCNMQLLKDTILPSGQYLYKLRMQLPPQLTPTFNFKNHQIDANVNYKISITITLNDDQQFTSHDSFICLSDAPAHKNAPINRHERIESNPVLSCFGKNQDNTVDFVIKSPNCVFTPSKPPTFFIDICNDLDISVKVSLKIEQRITAYLARHEATSVRELEHLNGGKIPSHEAIQGQKVVVKLDKSIFENESSFDGSGLSCSYVLRVIAHRLCEPNMVMEMPFELVNDKEDMVVNKFESLKSRLPAVWAPVVRIVPVTKMEIRVGNGNFVRVSRMLIPGLDVAAGEFRAFDESDSDVDYEELEAAERSEMEARGQLEGKMGELGEGES